MNTSVMLQTSRALPSPAVPGAQDGHGLLEQAIRSLHLWQTREDEAGANRHGRCLEAVRAALQQAGLHLPSPQARPNNLALYNGRLLAQDPARWGWQPAPPEARYTLEYFERVGSLPDGRIAGHVALADHAKGTLYSSWDYPLTPFWQTRLAGSFVPLQAVRSPYLDLKVLESKTGRILQHLPACALLANDGHAYLQARVLAAAMGQPCEINDASRQGVLILTRSGPP